MCSPIYYLFIYSSLTENPLGNSFSISDKNIETDILKAVASLNIVFIFLLNTEADVAPRPDRIYMGHGLQPYKYNWNGTREDLFNNAHYGCGKEGVIGAYCTELIRQNGWKIPNDYPIKI